MRLYFMSVCIRLDGANRDVNNQTLSSNKHYAAAANPTHSGTFKNNVAVQ